MNQPHIDSNSIEAVPFDGQTILAQKEGDRYLVVLRRLCENIGLDYSSQRKRLERQPWATVVIMTTVGADGKQRDMAAVDRKTMLMWLATIDTSRMTDPHARATVTSYQQRAADVLDKHFAKQADRAALAGDSDMLILSKGMLIAKKKLDEAQHQIETDRPFTVFGRALSVTTDDIQVGQLAKILRQNGYKTGPNLLFKQWLAEKVIYRKKTGTNRYEYWPMQSCLNAGWFKMKGHSWIGSDGKHESFTLTVTPKGQRHFLNKYLRDIPAMIGKEAE